MSARGTAGPNELIAVLAQRVVGQPTALRAIAPYIEMFQAGLSPEGRPIGIFLLLGPTGTGKTRTVEVLAEVLHGDYRRYVRIDCGEYQHDHEIAKLIGAPPGYLGHRETTPMLSVERLTEATSPDCGISLVLFDEVEKAAPALTRLLLGVLDKAILKLGDNTTVSFEKSLIFLTSNLGASDMIQEMRPSFGYGAGTPREFDARLAGKLEGIALAAVRKRFSPEFVNRLDAVVTYQPLTPESLAMILHHQIEDLQRHVNTRLGPNCFGIEVTERAKEFLLKRGTSAEYGARELKRVVHRYLMQPLATQVVERRIGPGSRVSVDVDETGSGLSIRSAEPGPQPEPAVRARVLIVDDNTDLLRFLKEAMRTADWNVRTAETAEAALAACSEIAPDLALVDVILPDTDGLQLSAELQKKFPSLQVIIMTGGEMSSDEQQRCANRGWLIVTKPFMVEDVLASIRSRLSRAGDESGAGPTVRKAGASRSPAGK